MVPRHILFIPDGNRRYSKKAGLDYFEGYKISQEKVELIVNFFLKKKAIDTLTIYLLSSDNLRMRKKFELDPIFKAESTLLDSFANDSFVKDNVCVRVHGNFTGFPDYFVNSIEKLQSATQNNVDHHLNLLIGYSAKHEILEAAKKTKTDSEREFIGNLMIQKPIDLVIRTSGIHRVSNGPLYQSFYAELAFLEMLFPEIKESDLEKIIAGFEETQRNFGA